MQAVTLPRLVLPSYANYQVLAILSPKTGGNSLQESFKSAKQHV